MLHIGHMNDKYTVKAQAVIEKAKAILAGGHVNPVVDVSGMSAIGQHVYGKINDCSFSPKIACESFLSESYSEFTAIIAPLHRVGSHDLKLADAAQDLIAEYALSIGFEI